MTTVLHLKLFKSTFGLIFRIVDTVTYYIEYRLQMLLKIFAIVDHLIACNNETVQTTEAVNGFLHSGLIVHL